MALPFPRAPRDRPAARLLVVVGLLVAGLGLTPAGAVARATPPLNPAALHAAYALPVTGAAHQVIAVISAYRDPAAQSDLSVYSKRYGLAPCTVANHCLRVLNQNGATQPQPAADPTGGQFVTESALGLEIARAVCQSCSMMLVQANQAYEPDLATAARSAARAGATVIATSFNLSEQPGDAGFAADFTSPRTAAVAAVGDTNYTGLISFPSSLPDVLAVGGTQLSLTAGGGYGREAAWTQTVSGCSSFQAAPAWQVRDAIAAHCGIYRSVADVSAVADPGVVVHITGSDLPGGPWYVATGTSVSAPIIAGVIGLAGSVGGGEARMLYARAASDPGAFHDVRRGENGSGCPSSICRAGPGYDGPTGLGTPFGLAAFLRNGGALSARDPRLTLSLPASRRPNVSRRGATSVRIANQNPFAVSGTIILRQTTGAGARRRVAVLTAVTRFRLGPLARATVKLRILTARRALVRSSGGARVYAQVRATGAAGARVNFIVSVGSLRSVQ